MILSRPDILKAIERRRLRFEPEVDPTRIEQVSVDLLLGRRFTRFRRELPGYIRSVGLDPSIWDSPELWEEEERDSYVLEPRGFVLGQTLEIVTIPNDLVGLVEGRSSNARLGLSIHLTAPKIDLGFRGTIALEIANHGGAPIELRAGVDRLAQLILCKISRPLKKNELYGAASWHVFQGQTRPIPRGKRTRTLA